MPYDATVSDSYASGAHENPDRLRRDDGPCASGLSGVFRRLAGVCLPAHHMEGMSIDSERFDRLVRRFGQTRSRRQTLRGLAGAVAVGAFAFGGREASARCTPSGKGCKTRSQCCLANSGAPEVRCYDNPGKGPAKTCQACKAGGGSCSSAADCTEACCNGWTFDGGSTYACGYL